MADAVLQASAQGVSKSSMMPMMAADVGGSLLSNAVGMYEAHKNRQFQKHMFKNRHQYEVEDLRKAGLNPILSATGGTPGAPSGAMYSPTNPLQGTMEKLLAYRANKAQVDKLDADTQQSMAMRDFYSNSAQKVSEESALVNEQMQTEQIRRQLMTYGVNQAKSNSLFWKNDEGGKQWLRFTLPLLQTMFGAYIPRQSTVTHQ